MSSLALMGAGPEAGGAFNPATPGGLLVDWDFSTLGLADGTAIGSVTDGSGNGNTLTQATGSLQPIFKTAIQNGLGVGRFDNVDDVMVATSAVTPRHVFAVASHTGGSTFAGTEHGLISGTGAGGTELILDGPTGGSVWTNPSAGGLTFSTYYKDGTSLAATNMQAGMQAFATMALAVTNWPSLTLQVGKDRTLVRPWQGDVGRILVYSAELTGSNLTYVLNGLKTQWGTP